MFDWKTYLRKNGLSESSSKKDWRERISRCYSYGNDRYVLQFMALTKFFERGESDARTSLKIVCDLAEELGFHYGFSSIREKLRDGLVLQGAELIQGKNGHYQYIRTMMRYSGWMYVRFAKVMSRAVQRTSWERLRDRAFIEGEIDDAITNNTVLGQFLDDKEGDGEDSSGNAKAMVVMFFQQLAELYLKREEPFTVADIQKLIPIREKIATEIIKQMTIDAAGKKISLAELDVRPYIGVDRSCRPVYKFLGNTRFPGKTTFVFYTTAPEAGFASVEFSPSSEGPSFAHWQYCDGRPCPEGVPIEVDNQIVRVARYNDNGLGYSFVGEKTPRILCDLERDYLVLKLKKSGLSNEEIYEADVSEISHKATVDPGGSLFGGVVYKVVPLRGGTVDVLADSGACLLKAAGFSAENMFVMPDAGDGVTIGSDYYERRTELWNYLSHQDSYKNISREDARNRVYFMRGSRVFTEHFMTSGMSARYVWGIGTGNLHSVEIDCRTPFASLPFDSLWQRGRLDFVSNKTVVLSKGVTFIDRICVEAKQLTYDAGVEVDLPVLVGCDHLVAKAPSGASTATLDTHGIRFVFQVDRLGITLGDRNRTYFSLSEATNGVVNKIAKLDFEHLQIKICRSVGCEEVYCRRGSSNYIQLTGNRYSGAELARLFDSATEQEQYDIQVLSSDVDHLIEYRFEVSDTSCNTVDSSLVGDNLQLSLKVPYWSTGKPFVILSWPAHRIDQDPIVVEAKIHGMQSEDGCCSLRLISEGFGGRITDWGLGQKCVVACRLPSGRHELLTKAFFVAAPDGESLSLSDEDDAFGVRMLMAQYEIDASLSSELYDKFAFAKGDAARWNDEFVDRVYQVWSGIGLEYIDGFARTLVDGSSRMSGYFFLANGQVASKASSAIGWQGYVGLWRKEMFPLGIAQADARGLSKPSATALAEAYEKYEKDGDESHPDLIRLVSMIKKSRISVPRHSDREQSGCVIVRTRSVNKVCEEYVTDKVLQEYLDYIASFLSRWRCGDPRWHKYENMLMLREQLLFLEEIEQPQHPGLSFIGYVDAEAWRLLLKMYKEA